MLRDLYLEKTADGIFKADINCYLDADDGEYAVFRDAGQVMAEWYMLLINQECTYNYYKHHNLKMSDDDLNRIVPDVLGVMFDGSNALGVVGGKQICVGSIKWTGNTEGYKSSTQNSLIYLLANRSEDNENTKNVEVLEFRKIRKIRDLGEYETCDADGRIHCVDFSQTVVKMIMDGKAMRKFLHFKSASIAPSSPYVSVLKKCELDEHNEDYEYQEIYQVEGYHQCSLFPEDCPDLNEFTFIMSDISSDLDELRSYLKDKSDDKSILLFTNPDLLKNKIKCLKKMWNSLGEERGGYTEKQRKSWFKDNARDRLWIEFNDFGERDDIRDAVLGPLHLYERNNDKILQYLTIQRRVFDRDPEAECNLIAKQPKLKCLGNKLLKLIERAAKNQSLKVNVDGNRVKILVKILNDVIRSGLDEIDDLYDDESMIRMHKLINLQFLFYIESTFGFITCILDKYGQATDYDDNNDDLQNTLQRGLDLFHWFYSKCKWIVTPTTFDTFISLPFCLINLLHRNKEKKVTVCLKDVLDQETENNVKVMKDRFASNNQRKGGQCKTIMNSHNFASIGKLERNMFIMKYDNDYNQNKIDENTWFGGRYDISKFDNFSRKTMTLFRDLQFEDNPQIDALFSNERVRDLEEFILDHEVAKGVEDEYDSEEEE